MNKFVKTSAIVGGVWGFANGIFLVLSFLGGIPNTTLQLNSISYIFLPYYISSNILFTTVMQGILNSIINFVGTDGAGGLLLNISLILVLIAIPTLIGVIIIGGTATLMDKLNTKLHPCTYRYVDEITIKERE
jgi:hypothetical protein